MKNISNIFSKVFSLLLIFLLTFSFAPLYTEASEGEFVWVRGMGGSSFDRGYSITLDGSGNQYITGRFEGTVDFDPGLGTTNLTSAGSYDIFILKLDSNGNFIWVKSVGGTGGDQGLSIVLDGSDNLYITGWFADTADFDSGAGTSNLTSVGGTDVYLLKLDSSGNYVWAKSFGGTSDDYGHSIVLDGSGNQYITGKFKNTTDFDPGAGTSNLTSVGSEDIFILKLDTNGDFVWAKNVGGTNSDGGHSIVKDSLGNIYITGWFGDTTDFDPGAGTSNITSVGSSDIYVLKLDSSGNYVWAKNIGGVGNDRGFSMTLGGSDNLYITGWFADTADFDPGAGTSNLTSVGSSSDFVLKLDSSGNYVWAKSFGGTTNNYGYSITLDGSGNQYITGNFQNTADFDPGVDTSNLTSAGSTDVYLLKLDSSGNYVWAKSFGGTSADAGHSITTDSLGNVYTTGYFQGIADFNPGLGVSNLTSAGSADIFILKLGDVPPTLTEVTPPPQVTVNSNQVSYTFSTDQAGTITYGGGCSSTTTTATVGNNTITLNTLSPGYYNNCTITVTDVTSNTSTPLTISPFNIVVHSGGGSGTPSTPSTPVITTPVITTPTTPTQTPEPTNTNPINNNTNQNQTTLGSNKLCTKELILTQNLKAGARDNRYHSYTGTTVKEVKILQAHMNRLNFNSGKVDGILGPITDGAIKRMQAYLGTTQDGLVGPITRDLINNSCN
jgi:hypothetical protein